MNDIHIMIDENSSTFLDRHRKNHCFDSYHPNKLQSEQEQRYLLQQRHSQLSSLADAADNLTRNFHATKLKLALDSFHPICRCQMITKKMLGQYFDDYISAGMAGVGAGFRAGPGMHPNAVVKNFSIPFNQNSGLALDPLYQIEMNLSDSTKIESSSDVPEKLECSIKSEEKSPKNGALQSKWKNCYGLIVGRVIKSCKEYFRLMKRTPSFHELILKSRLNYIHLRLMGESDRKSFQNYLQNYQNRESKTKRKRGKNAMLQFLVEGKENGIILAELIQDFLTEDNLDLRTYLNDSRKPKSQIIDILRDPRDLAQLREKFNEMEKVVKEKENDRFQSRK